MAFIGPNGSGKTTMLRLMGEVARFAARSFVEPQLIRHFMPFLSKDTHDLPTRVEMDMDTRHFTDDTDSLSRCRYILEVNRTEGVARVGHEALLVYPKGRPKRVFERQENSPIYVSRKLLGIHLEDKRLSAVPTDASAISALARMGVDPFPGIAQDLFSMQNNIAYQLDPWRPDMDTVLNLYHKNPGLASKASDRLKRIDLGVEQMEVLQGEDSKWHLWFRHNGLDVPVFFDSESAGTRHFTRIFPQLNYVLETGGIAIMDSIDSDFHTELMAELFDWFRREDTNPHNAQLICSLHNVSLLDNLEKEEVFIVEKDNHGVTGAYRSSDVSGLRRSDNLQTKYLGGALGGLPAFG